MHGEFPEKGTEELEVDMRGDSHDCCKNVVIKLPPTFFLNGNDEWVYFPLQERGRHQPGPHIYGDHWKNTTDYQKCTTNLFTVAVSDPTPFWKVLDDNIVASFTRDKGVVDLKISGDVVEWNPREEGKQCVRLYRSIEIRLEARWMIRYYSCEITNEQGEYWSHEDRSYLLGHRDSFEDENGDLDLAHDDPRRFEWDSWEEIDFEGAKEDDVYITIEAIGIQEMKLSDFKTKYGIGIYDEIVHYPVDIFAGPSYKYFNKQLVGIKNDYIVFEGFEEQKHNSLTLSFETTEEFDPSKIEFEYNSTSDEDYITDFEYDGRGSHEGWDCCSGEGCYSNFLRIKETDKWKRTAGEAIVRWYKCAVAKRQRKILRNMEKKRRREQSSREKFEAAAEKRRQKFNSTKLGRQLAEQK